MAGITTEIKYKLSVVLAKGGGSDELKGVLDGFACQEGISPQEIQIVYFDHTGEGLDPGLQKRCDKHGFMFTSVSDAQDILKVIEGDKVVFSNGYDVWEKTALHQMIRFLDDNQNTDVVFGKHISYFEKEKSKKTGASYSGGTITDLKGKDARPVVDIRIAMIRKHAIKKAAPYSGIETMDILSVLAMAVNTNECYGTVSTAILFVKDDWFNLDLEGLAVFAEDVRSHSVQLHGKVTNYAYRVICRMVMRAIRNGIQKDDVKTCLQDMPDSFIRNSYEATPVNIKYAYTLKYGRDIYKECEVNEKGQLLFEGTCVFDTSSTDNIAIEIIDIDKEKGIISFEGYTSLTLADRDAAIFLKDDKGHYYEAQVIDFPIKNNYGYDGEIISEGVRFVASAPLTAGLSYEFFVRYGAPDKYYRTGISFGAFSGINGESGSSYFTRSGYMVLHGRNRIMIKRNSAFRHMSQEIKYLREIYSSGQRNVVGFRLLYWLTKPFNSGKPIWFVVDRPHIANDNGEHFFRYLMNSGKAKVVKPFFLLRKDSPDFERLQKTGPVLEYGSVKHKLKSLHSSKIISAAGNNLALNPFGKSKKYYKDLYQFDFVYLRHGVSHNDQSSWLNRLDKNIRILVTTSKYERDSILAGNYLYDESRVWLTGLPRYDNLYDASNNKITIMPTWRKNLEGAWLPHSSERAYIRDFKDSDYYQFYNALINDNRLLDVMRKHGYTGTFYMHPVFEKQVIDFKSNDVFEVGQGVADYQAVFRESNLMVTDYSSVAFDFAYLKKPVIYAQFDAESFYKNHVWGKGYFTYEENGFGPITKDLDSTVLTLIDYIENDCKMKQEYVDRVEDFFAYTDRNNCERVYQAICTVQEH